MRNLWLVAIVFTLMMGCDSTYDAPPVAKLVVPDGGVYNVGDGLVFSFSEPIVADTLSVRVWYASRNIEEELDQSTTPLLSQCSVNGEDCPDAELSVSDDGLEATLTLGEDGLGTPDVPMTVEVLEGLSDEEGVLTGVSSFFDFQFVPSFEDSGNQVSFENGFFVLGAVIDDPIEGVNLKLVGEVIADENGRIAIAMGAADPIGDAPKNTMDPTALKMDSTDQGYGVHAMGSLVQTTEGDRFLETEAFEVNILIDNLGIALKGLTLSAKVLDDGEFEGTSLDGTLAYKELELTNSGEPFFAFEAGTVTFKGRSIPAADLPDGAPEVCGNLCGALTAQCNPPADFPAEGMCGVVDEVEEETNEDEVTE